MGINEKKQYTNNCKISICSDESIDNKEMMLLSHNLNLPISDKGQLLLMKKDNCWVLKGNYENAPGSVVVDFNEDKLKFRRTNPGVGKLPLASAIGIKKSHRPVVLDSTAGLGKDAFLLASLGSKVYLTERHPVIAWLLKDGLKRAQEDPQSSGLFSHNMHFIGSSMEALQEPPKRQVDVIYMDPMYPTSERRKSAKVKKEMQLLRRLIVSDDDASLWLKKARDLAPKVVVKRPDWATPLGEDIHASITSKNHRFDVYLS